MRKYLLYAKLKKCRFYQNKIQFLGYIISLQKICIKDKQIWAICNWLEPKSIWDIQVFLRFANFYWHFIQGFSQLATPLTFILKTIEVELSVKYLVPVIENSIVDEDGNDNKVSKVKNGVKMARSKNLVYFFLPKSKSRNIV